ncbi:MAG: hypothetical protein Q4B71_01430 [Cardiobacteriaceae bacterium]|nr:hypothetical protein [Cardiobacteriaceae bacterium]
MMSLAHITPNPNMPTDEQGRVYQQLALIQDGIPTPFGGRT